jgi:hypothetical protein
LHFLFFFSSEEDDGTGLQPIILRQPKQHLSQSVDLATSDGPMFIIFEFVVS